MAQSSEELLALRERCLTAINTGATVANAPYHILTLIAEVLKLRAATPAPANPFAQKKWKATIQKTPEVEPLPMKETTFTEITPIVPQVQEEPVVQEEPIWALVPPEPVQVQEPEVQVEAPTGDDQTLSLFQHSDSEPKAEVEVAPPVDAAPTPPPVGRGRGRRR